MFILFDLVKEAIGILRRVLLLIDSIGLTFIDNAYELIMGAISAFDETVIADLANDITKNCYIIVGIFALFRIALMLVNAIINPDKLNDKQEGYGNMLTKLIITIVLFIAVPIVFDMSRKLQSTIMDNNYISKLLIGKDLTGNTNYNPGKQMKDIAVRALIAPDQRFSPVNSEGKLEPTDSDGNYVGNSSCGNKCKDVLDKYNDKTQELDYIRLNSMIAEYEKVGSETVYILKYTPIVTLLVGGFITYVLLSFAIDIALRSVELIALEILSPLFIVTYIDPKQGSKGTFSKWLSTCGKTYVNLFIRIAVLCLMLLLVSKLDELMNASDSGGLFLKLLMLIAILIFAKKAPKWISGMLGMEGGMGELGVGKKLKDGLAPYNNRVTRGAAAIGAAAVVNGVHNARKKHQLKKDSGDYNKIGLMKKDKRRDLMENGLTDKDGNIVKGRKAVSMYKKDHGLSATHNAGRNLVGLGSAIASGIKVSGSAKGIFSATKDGIKSSGNYNKTYTGLGQGIVGNTKDKITDVKGATVSYLYGSDEARFKQQETLEKIRKAAAMTSGSDMGTQQPGIGQGKVIVGAGDTKKVCDFMTQQNIPVTDDNFRAVQYAINRGYAKIEMADDNKTIKNINLQDCIKFDSENKPMVMKDGQMVIDAKGLSVNLGGIMTANGDGIQIQEKLINGYQTTSINNYEKNEQNLSQYTTQNKNAREESNKLSVVLDNLQDQMKSVLSGFSSELGIGLQLDSLQSIRKSIDDASDNITSRLKELEGKEDEDSRKQRAALVGIKERLEKETKEFTDAAKSKDTYDAIQQSTLTAMSEIAAKQETLKLAIDKISGATLAEKANTLSIKAGDLDKYLNRNDKDKK